MRSGAGFVAILSIVAAVIGGVSALAVGKATGWLNTDAKRSIIVQTPAVAQAISSPPAAASAAQARPLLGNGFSPARIYQARSAGVVTIDAIYGPSGLNALETQGSGFVVSAKGYILTDAHVITTAGAGAGRAAAAQQLFVEFQDGDRVPAKVVGWDIYDDVGLVKVDPGAHRLAPVPLGESAQVKVGEPVAAIGSPFGNVNSLTVGVVSATRRSIDSLTSHYSLVDAIQTDAPINHGNSGGPLFDARGRVIGINAQIRSDTGAAAGVGFAVPIDSAKRSMLQLIAAGRVSYAYIGIVTEDLIPSVAKQLGYPVSHGAVITTVHPRSPGAAAGLRAGSDTVGVLGTQFKRGGDVIVSIAGHPVGSAADLVRLVTEDLSPGESVPVTFLRGNQRHQVTVKLGERPANPR